MTILKTVLPTCLAGDINTMLFYYLQRYKNVIAMKATNILFAVVIVLITISCSQQNKTNTDLAGDIPVCGTVQFSDGCSEELDKDISYGLALVHHMTFEDAEVVFTKVIEADSNCFWGHWGKALTYIHPLWNDPPSEERLKDGWNLSQKAIKLAKNEKELSYGNALAAYYEDGVQKTDRERLKNYNEGSTTAFEANPDDVEAKAFYALTLIAVADPADKTFANQRKAGALAEEIIREIKDHPAGFHYTIHAYDYPGLSDKALEVANKYGTIAPQIPHALHMPSHIFTRQGMWKESIEWNSRSAAASLEKSNPETTSTHYFHALDYMVYAYLQLGDDNNANTLIDKMKKLDGSYQPVHSTAHTLAVAEGRYYLERQDWKKASTLALPDFAWDKFPEYEALNHFVVGLGAARSGSMPTAALAMGRLDDLQQLIKNPYWAGQVEIQKNIVKAWAAFSGGSKTEAVELMKLASDLEWATQKHPITPGELLPARELFGDLLLELNRPKEALEQYEMSLQRSPNRLNGLYGAARAAELSGDQQKARLYYQQMLDLTSAGDATLNRRQKAMEYLKVS
jgi:tetratricopeptide (TPR) repeat protein